MRDNRRTQASAQIEPAVGDAADRRDEPPVVLDREERHHRPEAREPNEPLAEEELLGDGDDERAPDQANRNHHRTRLRDRLRASLADDAPLPVPRPAELLGQNPNGEDGETDEEARQEGGL